MEVADAKSDCVQEVEEDEEDSDDDVPDLDDGDSLYRFLGGAERSRLP